MDTVKYRDLWYIAKYGDGTMIDDAIRIATKIPNWNAPPTTHWEGWEPDKDGDFRGGISRSFYGQCWTSTTRGNDNGTCVRPAISVLRNEERWLYTEKEVERSRFEYARGRAQRRVDDNLGYAWRNLPRYGMPLWLFRFLRMEDKLRETCSQHGEHWGIDMGLLDSDKIRSPRRLWHDSIVAEYERSGELLITRRLIDDAVVYRGLNKVGSIFKGM